MGQFLALGLTHSIFTGLEGLRKNNVSNEELRQEIQRSLSFDMTLYDEVETNKDLVFTLKDESLEKDLLPFLETFYPMVYRKPTDKEDLDILMQLRSTPSTEWLDIAHEKDNYIFQMDNYAESCVIKLSRDFHLGIALGFHNVILYHGHGKILTEGIGDFISFFNRCLHEAFKKHPIARSMQVYITG
jgi:hypothetical protein